MLAAIPGREATTVQRVIDHHGGVDEAAILHILRRLESDRVVELALDDVICTRLLSDAATGSVTTGGGW